MSPQEPTPQDDDQTDHPLCWVESESGCCRCIKPKGHPPEFTTCLNHGARMLCGPELTLDPDDQTPAEAITAASKAIMRWVDTSDWAGLLGCTPAMIAQVAIEGLKSAGYELVNQVGTVRESPESWQHIVGGPSYAPTATDDQVINPPLVELTARWIGERESTHLWPEIREDDKACYRDAARHLLATISYSDYCPRS